MFILDDLINAYGASRAADSQEAAAMRAMDFQKAIYEQSRKDQMPWLQAGQTTLADLMRQMQSGGFDRQFDASSLGNDPGFQFRMQEGQKALERSAAARGGLNSGGFMKGLARYSQGLASDEFQNAWSRNQAENTGRYNRLANIAGLGQTTATNLGNMGAGYADSMSNLYGAMGNAEAARAVGVANGVAGGVRSAGNLAMLAFGAPPAIPTQAPTVGSMVGGPGRGWGPNTYGGY